MGSSVSKWSYEQVEEHAKCSPEALAASDIRTFLIDVRSEGEVSSTGLIPNSIHIPLDQLQDTLSSLAKFKAAFDKSGMKNFKGLPDKEIDCLVFSCQSGMRASRGTSVAQDLGFQNVHCYSGSWSEWSARQKQ